MKRIRAILVCKDGHIKTSFYPNHIGRTEKELIEEANKVAREIGGTIQYRFTKKRSQ